MSSPDSGRVVIHAGMGKAGSTAIQRWLARHPEALARHGYTLVVAHLTGDHRMVEVRVHSRGAGSSGSVAKLMRDPGVGQDVGRRLVEELDRAIEMHGKVVISHEAFSSLFNSPDRVVLTLLGERATVREVHVAYYVRPQHTALEAAWRQWGFRSGEGPARYLGRRGRTLHYAETLCGTAELAPDVRFQMRPFRRDLLVGGDVVRDFALHFLGVDPAEVDQSPASNVGMPLGVVNALQALPEGRSLPLIHDNRGLERLKRLVAAAETRSDGVGRAVAAVETNPRVDRGRRVLQRWAHRRYGVENDRLLRLVGWDAPDWLPDVEAESDDLAALDSLWSPSGSAEEAILIEMLLAQEGAPEAGVGEARAS